MNYFFHAILNFVVICSFLSGKNGFNIGLIILIINLVFYFIVEKSNKKQTIKYTAHKFIRIIYEQLLYLMAVDQINIEYSFINNKVKNKIEKYSSLDSKLSFLDNYFQYEPFSMMRNILLSDLKKSIKIEGLNKVYLYSSYLINYQNKLINKKNKQASLNIILYINFIFLIIKILFHFEVDRGFYYLFFLIFIIEEILKLIIHLKKNKIKYNYQMYYTFLISLFYDTPYNSLECLINNINKKESTKYIEMLKSNKNLNEILVKLDDMENEDIIKEEIYILISGLLRRNSLTKSDYQNINSICEQINNSQGSICFDGIISITYYLLLIGILYFIYNILVRYGTF